MNSKERDRIIELLGAVLDGDYSLRIDSSLFSNGDARLVDQINRLIEKLAWKTGTQEGMQTHLEKVIEDLQWKTEELQARNEEFAEYADLLYSQKSELQQQTEELTKAKQRLEEEISTRVKLETEVIELSNPIIPLMRGIVIVPIIGAIDTKRAQNLMRSVLKGIREHKARVIILDITGVELVDSAIASYFSRTVQAIRLKGAYTIVTGISDAVAETIVGLGIDWSNIETTADLQSGLAAAYRFVRK